jgi:hypothetical protein
MKASALWSALPRALVTTTKPPGRIHLLAFVCSRCHALHPLQCASDAALTAEERRDVLLQIEPHVIADGWSIGTDKDHCPRCSHLLGLTTARNP